VLAARRPRILCVYRDSGLGVAFGWAGQRRSLSRRYELITEWTPLNTEAPLGAGWGEARVHGLRVLAQVAEGQPARVVSATCTHCGAHLHPEPSGGAAVSGGRQRFRGGDGAVLEGPATTPIPRFEARLVGTGVEVRSVGATG
jgi:hypothetical protein